MSDAGGATVQSGVGLPPSPPIFLPPQLVERRPARGPWLIAIGALFAGCAVLASLSWYESLDFGGGPAVQWHCWEARALLEATGWPLLLLAVVGGVMALRRVSVRVRAALLAVAVLGTVVGLGSGIREYNARGHIQPALLSVAAALPVPPGLSAVGHPVSGLSPVDASPFFASAPEATWFWKATSTSACAALQSAYGHRAGWSFSADRCEARSSSGRVALSLRGYDAKDLGVGTPSQPGVVVTAEPND